MPAVINDLDEDPDDAVVLKIEDAPRRKRLYDLMVKFGHPVWIDEAPPSQPVKRHRPTLQEECDVMYRGAGTPPTKTPWRYGR